MAKLVDDHLTIVEDLEALAKSILELLMTQVNPCDRETRIKRAMEFSVDKAVDEYLEVLSVMREESHR